MSIQPDWRNGSRALARPWDRPLARIRAAKLDRALAGGASPDSSRGLALRAEALRSPRMGRVLGQTLELVLAQPSEQQPLSARGWPDRERVDATRDALAEFARRLRAGPQADARGFARVRQLLSDGGGRLFWNRSREDLEARVREAIAAHEDRPDRPQAKEIR
jgi:hypothetical protein